MTLTAQRVTEHGMAPGVSGRMGSSLDPENTFLAEHVDVVVESWLGKDSYISLRMVQRGFVSSIPTPAYIKC